MNYYRRKLQETLEKESISEKFLSSLKSYKREAEEILDKYGIVFKERKKQAFEGRANADYEGRSFFTVTKDEFEIDGEIAYVEASWCFSEEDEYEENQDWDSTFDWDSDDIDYVYCDSFPIERWEFDGVWPARNNSGKNSQNWIGVRVVNKYSNPITTDEFEDFDKFQKLYKALKEIEELDDENYLGLWGYFGLKN